MTGTMVATAAGSVFSCGREVLKLRITMTPATDREARRAMVMYLFRMLMFVLQKKTAYRPVCTVKVKRMTRLQRQFFRNSSVK